MQSFAAVVGLGAIAARLVGAHGYVATVVADGQTYSGVNDPVNPPYFYQDMSNATDGPSRIEAQWAGWYALNQDNGFVDPNLFGTNDIACHKSATAGTTEIAVTAGSTVKVTWNTWPDSHHGPVMDYLAKCSESCTTATAGSLNFFKIQ